MVERADALIDELAARHGNAPEFLEQIRPMVVRILHPDTPDASRPQLLELVAETCERQLTIKRNGEELRAAFDQLFDSIRALVRKNLGGQ